VNSVRDGQPAGIQDVQVGSWRVEPSLNRICSNETVHRLEPPVPLQIMGA
jgi:hypothetical protein